MILDKLIGRFEFLIIPAGENNGRVWEMKNEARAT